MAQDNRTSLLAYRIRAVIKTIVLIPIWLIALPVRRRKELRHHSWEITDMHRSPYTKTAYVFSLVCWLLLVAAFIFLHL